LKNQFNDISKEAGNDIKELEEFKKLE
jgi:hypothetical protein